MKLEKKIHSILDPEHDRIPIGHLTYQCTYAKCPSGHWRDGTRKYVKADHFTSQGRCIFRIKEKEELEHGHERT